MSLVKKQNLILSNLLIILLLTCSISQGIEKSIFGKAKVIDGDTIIIKEKKNKIIRN